MGDAPKNPSGPNDGPPRLTMLVPTDGTHPKEQVDFYKAMGGKGKFMLNGPAEPFLRQPLLGDDLQTFVTETRDPTLQMNQFGVKTKGMKGEAGLRIMEMGILIAVRKVRARFPLQVHTPLGKAAGLSDAEVEALQQERKPTTLSPEEDAAYDICVDLLNSKGLGVSDEVFAKAKNSGLGLKGIAEVVQLVGLYATLGHLVNGFRVPASGAKNATPDPMPQAGAGGLNPGKASAEVMEGPERAEPVVPGANASEVEQKLYKSLNPKGSGRRMYGPVTPWMLSPIVGSMSSKTINHIHSGKLSIPLKCVSVVILYSVRLVRARFALQAHCKIGKSRGLTDAQIQAFLDQRKPEGLTPQEDAVYDLAKESQDGSVWGVSDATYAKAMKELGEMGIMEVFTICGMYWATGALLNTFRMDPVPNQADPMPKL